LCRKEHIFQERDREEMCHVIDVGIEIEHEVLEQKKKYKVESTRRKEKRKNNRTKE